MIRVLALVLLASAPARAQRTCDVVGDAAPACVAAPDASALARAGALYDEGHVHIEGGRWDDALQAFRESYRSSCVPAALLNMVVAYRGLGRWVEARAAARLLLERHPDLSEELRPLADEYLREATSRIAVLTLAGVPGELSVSVRVDGLPCDDPRVEPLAVSLDPGRRAVDVIAPDRRTFHWERDVAPGERLSAEVALPPIATDDLTMPLAIGLSSAGAALLGIAIALGVFFGTQQTPFDSSVDGL